MNTDSGKKKLLWTILFSIVAVIFCYLFIVVYFSFISPYNISLRLAFWPFSSTSQIGEAYNDAIVDVTFRFQNDEFEDKEISAIGVNVRKDGCIVLPYSEIWECDDFSQIKVLTNSGKIYAGEFLYGNSVYNLAVIKCKNIDSGSKKIKIPYVKIANPDDYKSYENVIVTAGSVQENSTSIWSGKVINSDVTFLAKGKTAENEEYFSYSVQDGFEIKINYGSYSFAGGAVFDRSANFLGFSYSDTLKITSLQPQEYFIEPAKPLNYFLSKVISEYKAGREYKNEVAEKIVGVDGNEANRILFYSKAEGLNYYVYYSGDWHERTNQLESFEAAKNGFYLFERFEYNGEVIDADAVIDYIEINGKKIETVTKNFLFDALYNAKAGDKIKISFKEFNGANYVFDIPHGYGGIVEFTI